MNPNKTNKLLKKRRGKSINVEKNNTNNKNKTKKIFFLLLFFGLFVCLFVFLGGVVCVLILFCFASVIDE